MNPRGVHFHNDNPSDEAQDDVQDEVVRYADSGSGRGSGSPATTESGSKIQNQSLKAYIGRMKPEQDKVYYVAAENYHMAANSPHLEIFKKKGCFPLGAI